MVRKEGNEELEGFPLLVMNWWAMGLVGNGMVQCHAMEGAGTFKVGGLNVFTLLGEFLNESYKMFDLLLRAIN